MRVEAQRMAVPDIPAKEIRARAEFQSPAAAKPEKVANYDQKYDVNSLKAAVDFTNEAIRIATYHLEFRLHEDSGRYQVKVIDSENQKVIREIPNEKMLEFSAQIRQMLDKALGILVDEKA